MVASLSPGGGQKRKKKVIFYYHSIFYEGEGGKEIDPGIESPLPIPLLACYSKCLTIRLSCMVSKQTDTHGRTDGHGH